jgi:hypothetical protein
MRPVRLVAQDAGLSRRKQGFNSLTGRQLFQWVRPQPPDRVQQTSNIDWHFPGDFLMTLSRAQRITGLKEIAWRLRGDEWHIIDVTLKQFGLPTSNNAHGGQEPYILAMVEDASDGDLIELAEYLGFQLEGTAELPVECKAWPPGTFRLFSDASLDRACVRGRTPNRASQVWCELFCSAQRHQAHEAMAG